MDFRIADTFTDSLARLTGDEQKAVKTTAFDLQMNPANPGISLHKLDRSRDSNFWSARVSNDIRLIVHRTASSMLLCYANHHDKAYQWAERRKLEKHPKTGAAQLVEIRERVKEIVIPRMVQGEQPDAPAPAKPALFADMDNDRLLGYGVPEEWLADVRHVNEDSLLDLADHLPGEASEALLELATGGQPEPAPATSEAEPFEHPDAKRRFRVLKDRDELERALEFPWDKWTVFLHPAQHQWVKKDYNGPARVSGSAGTGKTVVALHRAAHLAERDTDARVLLATFSTVLAEQLADKLRRLTRNQPQLAERIDVHAMDAVATRLHTSRFGEPRLVSDEELHALMADVAARHPDHGFTLSFLMSEWKEVVDAWQLSSWDAYRNVLRLGRKTQLPESRRETLWAIYQDVVKALEERSWVTTAGVFARLTRDMADRAHPPYDHAVIDEAQDINVAQLRFLAALGGNQPNSLFFAGDLGQRIFQLPFSWKSLGVDIRGRSRTLKINYRTSHQIRRQADRLLDIEVSDVDGNVEQRNHTVSVFNGPVPQVASFDSPDDESMAVGTWLQACIEANIRPAELGVFVRSDAELERARAAVEQAGLAYRVLDQQAATGPGQVSISTMHRAKGLEFRAVVVMACDDEIMPLESRIEAVIDEADLEEVYETERHLLYVACTRARDRLFVSGVVPVSEFVDDIEP